MTVNLKLCTHPFPLRVQVSAKEVPLAKAQAIHGLRAVFGEVYPDPVRVVRVSADTPFSPHARG